MYKYSLLFDFQLSFSIFTLEPSKSSIFADMSGTLTNFTDIRLIQPKGADTPYLLVGSYTFIDGSKKECHPFPLDMVLGVGTQGTFVWGFKGFPKRATGVHMADGTSLVADLERDGSNDRVHSIIDLNEHFAMGEHPNGQGEKVLIAVNVPVVFCVTDRETAVAFLALPEIQKPSDLKAPTVPDVNESVSASGSAKTTGYGRVLDASPTVFRIEKAAGQEVRINPYKASAEATAETSEIAGQSLPKCASVVATVNLIAIEGKGGDASAGLVIDSTIGIMGTSLDLKLLGTGTGPVMSVWTKHIRSGPVIPNPLTIGSWWGDMWSKVNEALTPRRPSSPSPALDRFLKTAFGKFISDPKFVEALENVADLVVYK